MSASPITSFTASVTGQSFLPNTQIDKAKKESPNSTASAGHLQQLKQIERPSEVVSPLLSVSKEHDRGSKSTLSFHNLIEKFDHIQSTPENTNNNGKTIVYSRPKSEVGGSDLGMLGKVNGEEFLIKTGLGRGLLSQIANHFFKGEMESVKKKAGYIVADYIRHVGENSGKKEALQKTLSDSLDTFFRSKDGQTILNKAKENKIDISDVNTIHSSLVTENPSLKNVLGVPISMDVINGTAGPQLVNDYQRTYLESHHIPNSRLFLVGSNPLIGSQFLQNAVPFDQFLLECFLPQKGDKTLKDFRNAFWTTKKVGVDAHDLEAANALTSAMTADKNLEGGKARLIKRLKKWRLEGLFASLLIRFTMGEKGDLGPDNMLVIKNKNGHGRVVNIDITGFRYPRQSDYHPTNPENPRDKFAYGWEGIIQNPDASLDKLLDESVFNARYLGGIDIKVQHKIIEALKEVIGNKAPFEIRQVRDWYASLDAEASKSSLKDLSQNLLQNLDASVAPDKEKIEAAIARNGSFIDAAVMISRASAKNEHMRVVAGSNLRA